MHTFLFESVGFLALDTTDVLYLIYSKFIANEIMSSR